MHNVPMTFATCVFRDAQAPILDLNRFVKLARGKGERMKESVLCLGEIFCQKAMRGMAIIAGGDGPMAGLCPGVEVILHDVTVGARPRIVAQIRRTLRVCESVSADPGRAADHECDQGRKQHR